MKPPLAVKLSHSARNANAKAKAEAERRAVRERYADLEPEGVRSYGEPWDSIIAAASDAMYPGDRGPHRGNKR